MFVVKGVEQLRGCIKDAHNSINEVETEKMVIQSKYKQLSEKTNLLL